MTQHFADKLMGAIMQRGTCACVGIDPVFERLPSSIRTLDRGDREAVARGLEGFCNGVVDAVANRVAVVKLNIAFFEPYRGAGINAYHDVVRYCHERGLLVIGDIKRGDIGHSSARYAAAHLVGDGLDDQAIPDAVTISGYLGVDGVAPFIDAANETGRGVFVLVHTSNASAAQVQHLRLDSERMVVDSMAELVDSWGKASVGACGYSNVGAVAAPGNVELAKKLRTAMGNTIFLVPGFGAQGRSLEQVAACFDERGKGAIVNASRSIIYAYEGDAEYRDGSDWQRSVEKACDEFVVALSGLASGD